MRTKAAKAADLALKYKTQAENAPVLPPKGVPAKTSQKMATSENFNGTQTSGLGQGSSEEAVRKVKELEKKVTKLRNDN